MVVKRKNLVKGGGLGEQRVSMGELEAGARQWEEPCDPGQVTQTLASSLHGPSGTQAR